jgi:hypothetical protein
VPVKRCPLLDPKIVREIAESILRVVAFYKRGAPEQ